MLLTVAETSEYASKIRKILALEERKNIIYWGYC